MRGGWVLGGRYLVRVVTRHWEFPVRVVTGYWGAGTW